METAGLDKLLLRKILMLCSAFGRKKEFILQKIFLCLIYTRKPLRLKTIHRIVLLTPSSGLVLRPSVFRTKIKGTRQNAVCLLWWRRPDLNRLPRQCECRALPGELRPHNRCNCITKKARLQVKFCLLKVKDIFKTEIIW